MALPKFKKKNKPSKYVPAYDAPWPWEKIYRHLIWPYTPLIIKMLNEQPKKFD